MTAASSSDTTAPASNARDSTWQKGNLSFLSDVFQATTEKHSATNTKKKQTAFMMQFIFGEIMANQLVTIVIRNNENKVKGALEGLKV